MEQIMVTAGKALAALPTELTAKKLIRAGMKSS